MTTQSNEPKAPKTPKPVGRPRVHAKRETATAAHVLDAVECLAPDMHKHLLP